MSSDKRRRGKAGSPELRSWRCRIGLHAWYTDSSLIASYRRCSTCRVAEDRLAFELTVAERNRIRALPPGASIADLYLAALGVSPRRRWVAGNPEGNSE